MKRRGATQIELIIYCILLTLLLVAMYGIYNIGREFYRGAVGSYLISADFENGLRTLRHELQETSLTSIRCYPNPKNNAARPGVSFDSARSYDDNTRFNVSPHGAPEYQKHVFYTLEPGKGESGNVVRWESKNEPKSFVPSGSPELPQNITTNHTRTVLRGICLPNQNYPAVKVQTDEHGGFRVCFVTHTEGKETLIDTSPALITAGDSTEVSKKSLTRVVHVQLKGVSDERTHANYFAIHFRVSPRR